MYNGFLHCFSIVAFAVCASFLMLHVAHWLEEMLSCSTCCRIKHFLFSSLPGHITMLTCTVGLVRVRGVDLVTGCSGFILSWTTLLTFWFTLWPLVVQSELFNFFFLSYLFMFVIYFSSQCNMSEDIVQVLSFWLYGDKFYGSAYGLSCRMCLVPLRRLCIWLLEGVDAHPLSSISCFKNSNSLSFSLAVIT